MQHKSIVSFSLAPLSLALMLFSPCLASAQQDSGMPLRGNREAMRMTPAVADLSHALDANKVADGFQFRARLDGKVKLENGAELPSGTLLVGTVTRDDMNIMGTSKLALRFTEAVMKDGQTIPVKVTIVGIDPGSTNASNLVDNTWSDGTLAVDQLNVMSGVDLHSKIASRNSGVLVSSKKDVKLRAGSELELAIAELTPRQQAMTGM